MQVIQSPNMYPTDHLQAFFTFSFTVFISAVGSNRAMICPVPANQKFGKIPFYLPVLLKILIHFFRNAIHHQAHAKAFKFGIPGKILK